MKKIVSVLTVTALILSFSVVFASGTENQTVFYLDKGDVVINEDSVRGYDINGRQIDSVNSSGYTVTQTDSSVKIENSISVESGNQKVKLKNLNILRSGSFDFAVCVLDSASAVFTLEGVNYIKSGLYRAAIDIAQTAEVTIEGEGTLYASSDYEAGIGGGNSKSNGKLTINSGTIYSQGGIKGYGSGIGGAPYGSGGTITINGGFVWAIGGDNGAGIGGGNLQSGGNITINGGTVTAQGGSGAAGIGGGFKGNGGTIRINGGSVKAIAGKNALNIGNGYNCDTTFSGLSDSEGNLLTLFTAEFGNFAKVFLQTIDSNAITMPHKDDTKLYFYLPTGKSAIILLNEEGTTYYIADTSTLKIQAVNPFEGSKCKFFKDSLIINSSIDEVKLTDNFKLQMAQDINYQLIYNSKVINRYTVIKIGDVNFDNKLNSFDALTILKFVVELSEPNELQSIVADCNNDGKVSSYDALIVLKKVVGII